MTDKTVSMGCVIAYGMWALAGALLLATWATDDWRLGHTALVLSAAATVAHIRQFFTCQTRVMRDAYELGQESVRLVRR